jgi:hypothetical protein
MVVRQGIHRKCWSEFLCLGDYLAKWGGGCAPRDALGPRPSADPRRWRPAAGPVAGANLSTPMCTTTLAGYWLGTGLNNAWQHALQRAFVAK